MTIQIAGSRNAASQHKDRLWTTQLLQNCQKTTLQLTIEPPSLFVRFRTAVDFSND